MMLSSTRESVLKVRNLREFFRESVDSAISNQQLSVTDHTSHYVVNLLTLFARSEEFYRDSASSKSVDPLARILARALASESEDERNFGLQRLGDIALFVAGFFSKSLEDSAVDKGYYVDMGGNAYGCLADYVRGTTRGRAIGPVFNELAFKFVDIVDVLNEVRDQSTIASATDVLEIYKSWQKTGSKRAAQALEKLGIALFPTSTSRH